MSITVVARRQAAPGRGAALASAISRLVGTPVGWPQDLCSVKVFRNADDTDLFLSLSEWGSREAYLSSMAERAAEQLDSISLSPPDRYFFRPWVAYAIPGTLATAVESAVISYSPEQTAAVHLFVLREAVSKLRNQPGFCYRRVLRDVDTANRLLIVRGWDSLESLERFVRDVRPTFEERRPPIGVTVDHFVGILDIDLRHPERAAAG
jgi:heme-degrading monooxygenase HmoA